MLKASLNPRGGRMDNTEPGFSFLFLFCDTHSDTDRMNGCYVWTLGRIAMVSIAAWKQESCSTTSGSYHPDVHAFRARGSGRANRHRVWVGLLRHCFSYRKALCTVGPPTWDSRTS